MRYCPFRFFKYRILILLLKIKLKGLDKLLPYFEEIDIKLSIVLKIDKYETINEEKLKVFKEKEKLRNELREIVHKIKSRKK